MDVKPAPGELELVRSFVNTLDVEDGDDELASASALSAWLREHGLLEDAARVTRVQVARAIELREALRTMAMVNAGDADPDEDAAAVLGDAARRARLALRFTGDGSRRLEPEAPGVDGALGRIAVRVADAMADGSWARLKACRLDTCRWAFYDSTKNRSGAWCDMAVCGNRAKARAYRERHSH